VFKALQRKSPENFGRYQHRFGGSQYVVVDVTAAGWVTSDIA